MAGSRVGVPCLPPGWSGSAATLYPNPGGVVCLFGQRDAWWGGASVTTLGVTLRGGRRDALVRSLGLFASLAPVSSPLLHLKPGPALALLDLYYAHAPGKRAGASHSWGMSGYRGRGGVI